MGGLDDCICIILRMVTLDMNFIKQAIDNMTFKEEMYHSAVNLASPVLLEKTTKRFQELQKRSPTNIF